MVMRSIAVTLVVLAGVLVGGCQADSFAELITNNGTDPSINEESDANGAALFTNLHITLVARQAHNLKVLSSNLTPVTKIKPARSMT